MNVSDHQHSLCDIQGFLLDMDGSLYLGDQPISGSHAFLAYLQAAEIPFYCLTNNSSKSPKDYIVKLTELDYQVKPEQVLTSGQIAEVILTERKPGASIYVVGTPSLEAQFGSAGFTLDREHPELILVGFDTGLDYDKLSRLCTFVRSGLPYYATHPDFNCPTETGPIPDIGATLAYVEAATGRMPDEIFGKPYPALVEVVQGKTGIPVTALAMVGDRLYTDIAIAQHGLKTILVLSGESTHKDVETSDHKPHWVFDDVGDLLVSLKSSREAA